MRFKPIFVVIAMALGGLLGTLNCRDESNIAAEIQGYTYRIPPKTDDGWDTASLGSVGINAGPIENLVRDVSEGAYGEIHSLVIVKDDKLVFEAYWPGHDFGYYGENYHGAYIDFDRDTRHNTHSATKSFASSLVGIAIDKDFIHGADDSIFEYLPASYDLLISGGRESITLRDCLMMASGLEWNEWDVSVSNNQHDIVRFNQSADPVGFLLSKPIVSEPGTQFYYNGGTVDLLGVLVANASESSVESFSSESLFRPMGITNYEWQNLSPSGITCCHGDIYITPRDMAKFGYLFLNDGVWKGERLISSAWVHESTRYHISPGVSWANGYGYLWWLRNFNVNGESYSSFKAIGWGGQEIFIFTQLNMVVVFTGANYMSDPPCDTIVRDHILQAIQ